MASLFTIIIVVKENYWLYFFIHHSRSRVEVHFVFNVAFVTLCINPSLSKFLLLTDATKQSQVD